MYQVTCDGFPLLDLRDDDYTIIDPKVKVEVNTIGEASFTIYKSHPYYDVMYKLKSIFEVRDEIGVIFRGRMTNDSTDFDNGKNVDLEGVMGFFNDSIIRPFAFPGDFGQNADYIAAAESGNVVAFFLEWLISEHNSQVQAFQRFKLGNVTVSDPNNYITRSSTDYATTWDTLKSKLFDSSIGGYLCIRYEDDGNYIDYLSEFDLTNTQIIEFGENLLDLNRDSDAIETYTACIPLGAEIDSGSSETKKRLTLESIADGDVDNDIVKEGDTLYSRSAVQLYGWKCAKPSDTTWNDVTVDTNLLRKAADWLSSTAIMLTDTVEITAVDLHFSDAEIRSFRIYRNIRVLSLPHNLSDIYQLTRIEYDLLNPQNTKITVGKTRLTLTDINNKQNASWVERVESVEKDIAENRTEIQNTREEITTNNVTIINDCRSIIMEALETYVLTSDYEEFRQTVETQFNIMAGEIEMNFEKTTTQITDVDGDLQSKFNQVYRHITFSTNGITIGGNGGFTLEIDNNMIAFKKNGVTFGWWDGVDFHTGNIVVEVNERAQFGNFAFVPRSDGSLSFLKVGE